MKSLLLLSGGAILLWGILLIPGWMVQGEQVWWQSATALGLTLIPALAALTWLKSARKSPEMQLAAIFGGTGLRLAFAAGGGMACHHLLPEWYPGSFFVWLGAFYCAALALEISLALRMHPAAGEKPTGPLSLPR